MDGQVFQYWLNNIFLPFVGNRKVLLLLDNCPGHVLPIGNLPANVRIEFLPPNTTSKHQPLDQGIIRCLKAWYRRSMLRARIQALESGLLTNAAGALQQSAPVTPPDVYQAMVALGLAWDKVTVATIQGCWKHACILPPPMAARLSEPKDRTSLRTTCPQDVADIAQMLSACSLVHPEQDAGETALRWL